MSERIIFFAHSGVRVRPARHTQPPRRDAVRPSALKTPAEILAGAAYSQRSSSNAKSLWCAVSANSPKIMAAIQMDFVPDGFRSSSPTTPATQSVSPMCRDGPGSKPHDVAAVVINQAAKGPCARRPISTARRDEGTAAWARTKETRRRARTENCARRRSTPRAHRRSRSTHRRPRAGDPRHRSDDGGPGFLRRSRRRATADRPPPSAHVGGRRPDAPMGTAAGRRRCHCLRSLIGR